MAITHKANLIDLIIHIFSIYPNFIERLSLYDF